MCGQARGAGAAAPPGTVDRGLAAAERGVRAALALGREALAVHRHAAPRGAGRAIRQRVRPPADLAQPRRRRHPALPLAATDRSVAANGNRSVATGIP
jgi:hypothetical protein